LDGIPFHTISEEEAEWVERAFEDMEVFEVVKDTNRDKDSGLDGFYGIRPCFLGFYQSRCDKSLS